MLNDLLGQILDEKYRVEKKLGQGGMGAVYLATHLGTGRPVALKVIAPQYMANVEFVERFKREAKAAGLLRHPNVVNVTDFSFTNLGEDRLAYLVMEYLDGTNLGDLMKQKGQLPLSFVVDIVEQTCLALDQAHKNGIIHRDLKPDNIWLEPNRRGGYNVKVLDFGLAKLRDNTPLPLTVNSSAQSAQSAPSLPTLQFVDTSDGKLNPSAITEIQPAKFDIDAATQAQTLAAATDEDPTRDFVMLDRAEQSLSSKQTELTSAGTILGTPLYMSPEQCAGKEVDRQSDIYSLAVIIYQMLAGEAPFTGNIQQLIAKHRDLPPPSLKQQRSDLPESVTALVMSGLAKTPSERPDTAMAFSMALRANAEGANLLLRKSRAIYRENPSAFATISGLIQIPVMILNLLILFGVTHFSKQHTAGQLFQLIHKAAWPIWFFSGLFANGVNTAACALAIKQLRNAPGQRVQIKPIFIQLKKRLASLAITALRVYLSSFLQLFKLIVPAWSRYLESSLYAPIVVLEEERGEAALKRSKLLVGRARQIAQMLEIREIFAVLLPLLVFPLLFVICGVFFDILKPVGISRHVIVIVLTVIMARLLSLVYPSISIAQVMLYFKSRQAGGEQIEQEAELEFSASQQIESSTIPYKLSIYLFVGLLIAFMGWTVLRTSIFEIAIANGYTDTVAVLLATGVDINSRLRDATGNYLTPLEQAIDHDRIDIVKLLLDKGADINLAEAGYLTPLELASANNNVEIAKLLLDRGADVNTRDKVRDTALIWAADSGPNCVQLLIDRGADVNARSIYGMTPLLNAAQRFHPETIKLLLAHGADVNVQDNNRNTALIMATSNGNYWNDKERLDTNANTVKLLINGGVQVDLKDDQGKTALLSASCRGHIDEMKLLIDGGADINTRTNNGGTILISIETANKDHALPMELTLAAIKLLLARGVDINAKDNNGKTALMLATEYGQPEIVQLLKESSIKQ